MADLREAASAFASEAELFVAWFDEVVADETSPVSMRKLHEVLGSLQAAAARLTGVAPGDEVLHDCQKRRAISAVMRNKLPIDAYSVVFNPLESDPDEVSPPTPVMAAISDDLGDIYHDLMQGLALFRNGQSDSALWQWHFTYYAHWGRHLSHAQSAIWQYLSEGNRRAETSRTLSRDAQAYERVRQSPADPQAYLLLASSCLAGDRAKEALGYLLIARASLNEKTPTSLRIGILEALALAYLHVEPPVGCERSIICAQEALELHPEAPASLHAYAAIAYGQQSVWQINRNLLDAGAYSHKLMIDQLRRALNADASIRGRLIELTSGPSMPGNLSAMAAADPELISILGSSANDSR